MSRWKSCGPSQGGNGYGVYLQTDLYTCCAARGGCSSCAKCRLDRHNLRTTPTEMVLLLGFMSV